MKKYYDCPTEATLEVLAGKWKTIILYYLEESPRRFSELEKLLETCSERMLAKQLTELQQHGLIQKEMFAEMPPRSVYSLTDYGRTLLPIIDAMCAWGETHLERTGKISVYN